MALLYSTKYPADVESVVFECPSFCNADTTDYVIEAIKSKLTEHGYDGFEAELLQAKEGGIAGLWGIMGKIPGHVITEIYHPFPIDDEAKARVSEFTAEEAEKTRIHCELVIGSSTANENHFHRLSQLPMPALLMLGEHDVVCSPKQQEAFINNVANGQTVILPNCGHTLHSETPKIFVEKILAFI